MRHAQGGVIVSKLFEQIQNDLKDAMKAKDDVKLSALRMLKSAVKNLEIDNPGKPLSDEQVLGIVRKQVKQREEAALEFEKGARKELADKERAEAGVLSGYLPKQISDEELAAIAGPVLEENGIQAKKDFGRAMKLLQEAVSGGADNKRISQYLNGVLQ